MHKTKHQGADRSLAKSVRGWICPALSYGKNATGTGKALPSMAPYYDAIQVMGRPATDFPASVLGLLSES